MVRSNEVTENTLNTELLLKNQILKTTASLGITISLDKIDYLSVENFFEMCYQNYSSSIWLLLV